MKATSAAAGSEPRRILVLRGGAIGDFILTLPVLAALRRHFPLARLTVVGQPSVTPLALAGGLADAAISLESRGLAGSFAPGAELSAEFRELFRQSDLIVSYLHDPDQVFQRNVTRGSSVRFLAGPHRPDDAAGVHATEALLKPLRKLGITDADTVPRLRWPGGTGPHPGGSAPRWLAVHPGSGSERKNWPETQWATLLERLAAETELGLLLVGGEAEGGRVERLAQSWPAARCRTAMSRPLLELAALLRECCAFAGHDSGITHLAAAVGLPLLVLWGGTAETVWRPRGERIRLLRGRRGLASLIVSEVRRVLNDLLASNENA